MNHKNRTVKKVLMTACSVIALLGVVMCGYGYAAVSSDLLISGEATVVRTGTQFTSKYMQDVTPQECENLEYDATSQLIDKRDGRKYWVAKLRDGACWMVQDLKFDLIPDEEGNVELTSELSDINVIPDEDYYEVEVKNGQTIYKWNQNVSSLPPTETYYRNINTQQKTNTTFSWNFGEYVARPGSSDTNGTRIFVIDEDEEGNPIEIYAPSDNLPDGVAYDNETMTYDTHYLVGNYYQWNTATAGGWKLGGEPYSSICPKGWGLPPVPDSGAPFDEAIDAYVEAGLSYNMAAWPFYISRGGYYLNTSLSGIGGIYYYWLGWITGARKGYVVRGSKSSSLKQTLTAESPFMAYTVRCKLKMGAAD